jgi:hypothetical protein
MVSDRGTRSGRLESLGLVGALAFLGGCWGVPPPASQVPTAAAAVERMRATLASCNGVHASAKFEVSKTYALVFSGSVRGDLLVYAATPARIRMDVINDFGVSLATLTSDGARFALADLRAKRFYVGPASACNIARLTTVPIPANVLVDLLLGRAPVLKRAPAPAAATIEWSGNGYYVVSIPGTRDAFEEIHLTPAPADLGKPWTEQRMRVLRVTVRQYGHTLYRAALDGHARAPMATERVDVDGIDPPIPPSGPYQNEEIDLRSKDVTWNPPLPEGIFEQPTRPDLPIVPVQCE